MQCQPLISFALTRRYSGHFGSGMGEELSSPDDSERGSYIPVWLPITSLVEIDVRPKSLANSIVEDPGLSELVKVTD